MTLPVAKCCDALLDALEHHPKVLLSAPPGAGKSTYLPLFLLQSTQWAGKTIVMLEPRRLAAKSIATYLAKQLGEPVGLQVGYQIRHEQKHSEYTRLLLVTEGVLLRKIQRDPELLGIDLVIFDEFHERSLHADIALALTLEVQALNESLKLLLMSATLDLTTMAKALDAPVIRSTGQSYPVEVRYQAPTQEPLWQQCARLALLQSEQEQGSCLVFLPGQREIENALAYIRQLNTSQELDCFALLGALSLEEQQQAIAPSPVGRRKIVLCTNIAETSLTIEGIRVVIDSGQAREAVFHPRHGLSRLETIAISQASAVQRAGRAGRLGPGICYRLDTPEHWQRRPAFSKPAILQSDLTSLVLEVSAWGASPEHLFWLDLPPESNVIQARGVLELLGALDAKGQLSAFGQSLLTTGLDPRLAAMFQVASELERKGERGARWLALVLQAFLEQRRFTSESNLDQLLSQALPAVIVSQAKQQAKSLGVTPEAVLPVHLSAYLLSCAFPDRVALKRGKGYQLANGAGVQLLPGSSLQTAELLVIADVVFKDTALVSLALPWSLTDLKKVAFDKLNRELFIGFDDKAERFIAEEQLCFGKLVLERKPLGKALNEDELQQGWLRFFRDKGLSPLPWTEQSEQFKARTRLASTWSDVEFPAVDEESLLAQLQEWLLPFLTRANKVADLQKLDMYALLEQRLSYPQKQRLQKLCPDSWCSVLGTKIALNYQADGEVVLAVRLQEMFGQLETPTVGEGKKAVRIELLSPAKRPLQVTKDLASFWQNSYQDVKKEMKGRYPKHYWPDDPAQAMPTNKTKKAMQR